jgi:hypothetical protein
MARLVSGQESKEREMTPTPDGLDEAFGDSSFDVTSSGADCPSDSIPADASANAIADAQGERFNAWVAMLRWYELPQPLIH